MKLYRPRNFLLSTILSLSVLVLTLLIAGQALADSAVLIEPSPPAPRAAASAIWTGDSALILGGCPAADCGHKWVVEFNPSTGSMETVVTPYAFNWGAGSAIWDGKYAFLFGGYVGTDGEFSSRIYRYHPASMNLTTMSAAFPHKLWGTSAVWDGEFAYMFGGRWLRRYVRISQI